MKIFFSIVCGWTSFHIFTTETNPISLWFAVVLAGISIMLLGIYFSNGEYKL